MTDLEGSWQKLRRFPRVLELLTSESAGLWPLLIKHSLLRKEKLYVTLALASTERVKEGDWSLDYKGSCV